MDNDKNRELEDFGWESMRAMLDKEMPTAGVISVMDADVLPSQNEPPSATKSAVKKRNWIALLLLLTFSGCGVAAYQYWVGKNGVSDAVLAEVSTAPIVDNSVQNDKEEMFLNSNNAYNKKPNKDINTAEKGLKTNDLDKKLKQDFNKKAQKYSLKTTEQKTNLITPSNPNNNTNSGIISQQPIVKPTDILSEKSAFDAIIKGEKRAENTVSQVDKIPILDNTNASKMSFISVPFLPQLSFKPIESKKLDTNSLAISSTLPIVSTHKKNSKKEHLKPHFGLTIGANSDLNTALTGYHAGAFLAVPFSKKWAANIGLNYRVTNVNGQNILFESSSQNANNSSTGSTAVSPSNSFSLVQVNKIQLRKMNYIEMPIFIEFKMNKKWSFNSGVKLGYLVTGQFSTAYDSTSNTYVINNSVGSKSAYVSLDKNASIDPTKNLNSAVLERLDWALQGGIGYQFTEKWTIGMRYTLGINNVMKSSILSAHNTYLGLNMNYHFIGKKRK